MTNVKSIFPMLSLFAMVLTSAVTQADVVSPGEGWTALEHASVARTDKNPDVQYQVVTATVYGKRLPNGSAQPPLLVLRERTAARCADESCLYRYSAFQLAKPETVNGSQHYAGKPVELDVAFTRQQMPADYVVTAAKLVEDTMKCGKRIWTVQTKLEEGITVAFTGEVMAARPNPKFQSPARRP